MRWVYEFTGVTDEAAGFVNEWYDARRGYVVPSLPGPLVSAFCCMGVSGCSM